MVGNFLKNIYMEGPGWYSGFKVTEMIEGFFGFEIFNSGFFWVGKFGKYFFLFK